MRKESTQAKNVKVNDIHDRLILDSRHKREVGCAIILFIETQTVLVCSQTTVWWVQLGLTGIQARLFWILVCNEKGALVVPKTHL